MGRAFGVAEADAECPVSLDLLGQLYREDPTTVADALGRFGEDKRIRLALFCYQRAHLRGLALAIAETCSAERMVEVAGTLGEVLAAQSRAKTRDFGTAPIQHGGYVRPKVTLAGTMRG